MRILHVVTAFPRDERDIIAPWLVELIKRQRAAGHDAQVFAPSYHGSADHEFAGIPVHRFRYFFARWEALTHDESAADRMRRSLLYRVMPAPFVMAGMFAIWRLCRRERYDVVHVHWPVPLALWGWAARLARRAAVVLTFYGIELRWVTRSLPFLKGFVRWACRRADRVVGIGPERERLEALARERNIAVDFRNKVPDAELHVAFLTSDVLVLPSIIDARGDTEGLGVALLDAMSYCIPVIASRVGGIPDIIEDGVSGLLVPPADPQALADAIERVATDPALARRLAEAGRDRLRTRFSWDVITTKWDAVYRV